MKTSMSKEEKKVETAAVETKPSVDNKEMLELIKELRTEVKELKQKAAKQTVEPVVGYRDVQVQQQEINNPYEGKSKKELMDMASADLIQHRNEFNDRITYTKDIRYSAQADFSTWEEIAVLRAYDEMDDKFKERFGKTYENLRQGKYHQILDDEIKRVETFRRVFREIDGQEATSPYTGYNELKYMHANLFLNF